MNDNKDPRFSSTVVEDVSSPSPPIDEQIHPVVLTNEDPLDFNDSNTIDPIEHQDDGWIEEFLRGFNQDQEAAMLQDDKFLDSLEAQARSEHSDFGIDQGQILEDPAEQLDFGVGEEQVLEDTAEQLDYGIGQDQVLEDPAEQLDPGVGEEQVLEDAADPQSGVVKSSNTEPRGNFRNSAEWVLFSERLEFLVLPELYQRARYEKELNDDLRYITVPNDGSITLTMPNCLNNLPPGLTPFMRITRTTTPHGPDNIMCCHPYPLWLKDTRATVHDGSLLVPIDEQVRANLPMKFEHLIMQRLKQPPLKQINRWPIYKDDQLDCYGFHPVDTKNAKRIIREYNLRYSILHFQVFLIDQNQQAYATDLRCQTEAIYEYEAKELASLPTNVALSAKRAMKRLQRTPRAATAKKGRKMAKPVKDA